SRKATIEKSIAIPESEDLGKRCAEYVLSNGGKDINEIIRQQSESQADPESQKITQPGYECVPTTGNPTPLCCSKSYCSRRDDPGNRGALYPGDTHYQ